MAPGAVAMAKNNPKASRKAAPRSAHQAELRCGVCGGDHSPGPRLGAARPRPAGLAVLAVAAFAGSDAPLHLSPGSSQCRAAGTAGAERGGAHGPAGTKGSGPGAWSHLLHPEASTDLEVGS